MTATRSIIELVRDHPDYSQNKIAKTLNVSKGKVNKVLNKLKAGCYAKEFDFNIVINGEEYSPDGNTNTNSNTNYNTNSNDRDLDRDGSRKGGSYEPYAFTRNKIFLLIQTRSVTLLILLLVLLLLLLLVLTVTVTKADHVVAALKSLVALERIKQSYEESFTQYNTKNSSPDPSTTRKITSDHTKVHVEGHEDSRQTTRSGLRPILDKKREGGSKEPYGFARTTKYEL